jgi:hypothetical protein
MITELSGKSRAVAVNRPVFPATRPEHIDAIRAFEQRALTLPQADLGIEHWIHAGMYVRVAHVPAGVCMTNALIKIPTVLVVSGDVIIFNGADKLRLTGCQTIAGAAGRKQIFITLADTTLTMLFPTNAKTVEDAEDEFTDEAQMLTTRRGA